MHLKRSFQDLKGDWNNLKSEEEWKPSRYQYCWDRPEFLEESFRPKETCCHSDSTDRQPANTDVKNSQHWEMFKKFKFDHTNKCYIHNPAPVLENDTHKILLDFDIQTDHLISARRPDLIISNKKREFTKLLMLLFQLTTEQNWKNVKRRISTSTLLENRKGCGTCT